MAKKSVVIEGQFGVECKQAAIGRGDERINLEEGSVGIEKRLVKVREKLHRGIDLPGAQPQLESHLARLKRFQAHARIDMLLQNGIWIFRGHLLYIHPA